MNERQVRRVLEKVGLALRKDRAQTRSPNHRGGYMVVDPWRSLIVAGDRYDLTLEEAAALAQ